MNAASSFTIFPAVDLRDGKVVRLAQGDPERQTTYGDDPLAWASRWQSEGAEWLHVINLSGAFGESSRANLQALESLLRLGMRVEYGGGIRDRESLRIPLEMGAERVFLGTAAIREPALVDWALDVYGPSRIAGDIGARDGLVAIRGWQEPTLLTALELGRRFKEQGLHWCVLTDVSRDGAGSGVNLRSAIELQEHSGLRVVASGGLSGLDEILRARESGLAGVIIGRALYEGQLSLRDCLAGAA